MSKLEKNPTVPPAALAAYERMLDYKRTAIKAVFARSYARYQAERAATAPPERTAVSAPPRRVSPNEVEAGRIIVRGAIALAYHLPWPWPPVAAPTEPDAAEENAALHAECEKSLGKDFKTGELLR